MPVGNFGLSCRKLEEEVARNRAANRERSECQRRLAEDRVQSIRTKLHELEEALTPVAETVGMEPW